MKRVVVVTGASSGIGKCTCEYLVNKDYVVYGLSRRKVASTFNSMQCDVTDREAFKGVMEEIYRREGRIDVLVNNAGMGISGAVEYIDNDKTDMLFDVNTLASFNTCQICIPYLREYKKIYSLAVINDEHDRKYLRVELLSIRGSGIGTPHTIVTANPMSIFIDKE